jgi:NAD(P)-dependent dehydrogenase (short-subunit alcohol dehydrogenase family)
MNSGADGRSDIAVVTGGASGFGRALAGELAARGHRIALLDRDVDRATTEAHAITAKHGVDALGLAVDVTRENSVDMASAAVRARFGGADVVISNVGVQLFGSIETFTDDEWRWMLDANVIGAARVARSFLPLLRASTSPRLAFTSSSSVFAPAARLGAYQASKLALWGLAETLRLELIDTPIAISVIFPSGMATRHLESSADAQPDGLRREVAPRADVEAMFVSNPDMAAALCAPEAVARDTVEQILDAAPLVVTHGDLVSAIDLQHAALRNAAARAQTNGSSS